MQKIFISVLDFKATPHFSDELGKNSSLVFGKYSIRDGQY
jgi:hypothetical protein